MALLANAQMTVSGAPGAGSFALNVATPGAQAFAAAGAIDGASYSYRAEGAAGWELGVGNYGAAGKTLTRSVILASSNANAAVAFGADVVVSQVALPGDLGLSFRQKIHNPDMRICQRSLSGTVTLAAGAYGHDGIKAGASGASYTFAAAGNGDVTLTGAGSAANTVQRVVEGLFYLTAAGAYVLAWTGTALARAYPRGSNNPPAFAAGTPLLLPDGVLVNGLLVPGVAVGTDYVLEWDISSGRTLGRTSFEAGTTPTPLERRDDEMARCRRYLRAGLWTLMGYNLATYSIGTFVEFDVPMCAGPSIVLANYYRFNCSSETADIVSAGGFRIYTSATSTGYVDNEGNYLASAEI